MRQGLHSTASRAQVFGRQVRRVRSGSLRSLPDARDLSPWPNLWFPRPCASSRQGQSTPSRRRQPVGHCPRQGSVQRRYSVLPGLSRLWLAFGNESRQRFPIGDQGGQSDAHCLPPALERRCDRCRKRQPPSLPFRGKHWSTTWLSVRRCPEQRGRPARLAMQACTRPLRSVGIRPQHPPGEQTHCRCGWSGDDRDQGHRASWRCQSSPKLRCSSRQVWITVLPAAEGERIDAAPARGKGRGDGQCGPGSAIHRRPLQRPGAASQRPRQHGAPPALDTNQWQQQPRPQPDTGKFLDQAVGDESLRHEIRRCPQRFKRAAVFRPTARIFTNVPGRSERLVADPLQSLLHASTPIYCSRRSQWSRPSFAAGHVSGAPIRRGNHQPAGRAPGAGSLGTVLPGFGELTLGPLVTTMVRSC